MANTTTITGNVISIVLDGSTDWLLSDTGDSSGGTTLLVDCVKTGLSVDSITFVPSAANDIILINEDNLSGAEIFSAKAATTNPITTYYHGLWLHPAIDASDCTLGTAANARVIIIIR